MKTILLRGVALAVLLAASAAHAQVAVGQLVDYSGATSDVGTPFGQGAADAMAWVNQRGGVNNSKENVDTVD